MTESHSKKPQTIQSPIFIGGAGRSGTTLLRVILDSHSNIACGPEMKVTPVVAKSWEDYQRTYLPFLKAFHVDSAHIDKLFREFLSGLLLPLLEKSGKGRIAEKSPNNVFFFPHLNRIFPDARFINMIRDGRDVVSSLLRMDWKSPNGKPIPYTQDVKQAASYWKQAVLSGRQFGKTQQASGKYLEIKYEDIVGSAESTLRNLFSFLGEEWESQTLSFHEAKHDLGDESSSSQVIKPLYQSSVGRWKKDLSQEDQSVLKNEIGDLLVELNYLDSND